GRTASASFLAEEDCRILVVDYAKLETRMAASAEFRAAVLETLAHVMAERVRRYIDVRVADSLDFQRISNESPAWAALEKELSRLKSMLRAADLERGGSSDMPTPEKAAAVKDSFHTICTELHRLFYHDESITPTDRRRIGTYLQGEFLPLIRLSRTPDRIFEKPHGYALDSLMLQMMLDGEPSGSGRLGAAIDSAFLAEPACQGIRNRSRWLVHEVEEMCAHR